MYHSSFGSYLNKYFLSDWLFLREITLQKLLLEDKIEFGIHWRLYKGYLLAFDCHDIIDIAGTKKFAVTLFYPNKYALGAVELIEKMMDFMDAIDLSEEEKERVITVIASSTTYFADGILCDSCYRRKEDCKLYKTLGFCSDYVPDIRHTKVR